MAIVALLLAVVLMQVPMQTTASMARGANAPAASAGASSERERGDPGAARNADPATGNDSTNSLTPERGDTTSGDGDRTPAPAGASAEDSATREARGGTNAVPAAEQAAAGGRDAGKTADTVADTGLTEAWHGDMATKLRELAAVDQQPSDADPTLAADYQPAVDSAGSGPAAETAFEPAAAVAPEARSRVRLGPAEQAYVRSYFADSGATP